MDKMLVPNVSIIQRFHCIELNSDLCVRSEECKVIVDLFKLTAEENRMDELDNFTQCASSEFSFPLAADDYFMTVAILAEVLSDKVAMLAL